MIHKASEFEWSGIPLDRYKDEPGTWQSVTRQVLSPDLEGSFEVRYFEIAPGGYSTYERHEHEHCVIALRGSGEVVLGSSVHEVNERDVIRVESMMPHQFRNPGSEPFGFLCIVDRERDRPEPLRIPEAFQTSK